MGLVSSPRCPSSQPRARDPKRGDARAKQGHSCPARLLPGLSPGCAGAGAALCSRLPHSQHRSWSVPLACPSLRALAKQERGLPESERCHAAISQPRIVVLGPRGLLQSPRRKITPSFSARWLASSLGREAVETAATLHVSARFPSEPHRGPGGPRICLASSAAHGAPAMEEIWKLLLQPRTAPALVRRREESRNRDILTPFFVRGQKKEGCIHTHLHKAARAPLGDARARAGGGSPGQCHCSGECHLRALEVLMGLKCIFQIFPEPKTPLPPQRGSMPARDPHGTAERAPKGGPRAPWCQERAEVCHPLPREQD